MGVQPDDDIELEFRKSLTVPASKPRLLGFLGPGLIAGASDDDPSGIGTYSQAGAGFGYALSWTMLFSYPLMCAVQLASAQLGRCTGHGIAGNLARHYPNWLLNGIVALLLIANTINIGADLGAMGDAVRLLFGGPPHLYVLGFGALTIGLQVFLAYKRYVRVLKWLSLTLFAYVMTLGLVHVDWIEAARSLVPSIQWRQDYITTIVAVLGTTISPYLFFWQASQEVEDIHAFPARHPLKRHPEEGGAAVERIRNDTLVGMAYSNIIALAIILTTAATLHQNGITDIQTSAQAAAALEPLAGSQAGVLFTLGVVGTGLLATPVLAGSAAYAVAEARRWPVGLSRKPREARAFYATIVVATGIGIALNFGAMNPIKALFWAAVINGVVAVPVMAIMMLMTSRRDIMGRWVLGPKARFLGWATVIIMALCVVAMVVLSGV